MLKYHRTVEYLVWESKNSRYDSQGHGMCSYHNDRKDCWLDRCPEDTHQNSPRGGETAGHCRKCWPMTWVLIRNELSLLNFKWWHSLRGSWLYRLPRKGLLTLCPFGKCLHNNFWLKLTPTGRSAQNIFKKMLIHLVLKMDIHFIATHQFIFPFQTAERRPREFCIGCNFYFLQIH